MSTSIQHTTSSATADEPRLINLRFSLRRLLSKTALTDVYWANDLHHASEAVPEKNALVLILNPSIPRLPGFASAWTQILSRPAPPAAAYPEVIAYGEDKGEYWLALDNIAGNLLSEQISELDNRGLPLTTALDTLDNISQTLSSVQAGPFGHLDPGTIQHTDHGYKILNAPIVRVLQKLTATDSGTINKLALHSSYLSPSVAVGDAPITEDDTFSAAALLYTLLAGREPFDGQSTLTAVAHGDKPHSISKLKKDSWDALNSAMFFQRSQRPENPEKLIQAIRKNNKRKIALPIAVLAATGVAVFAGYHLVNRLGDLFPSGTEQTAKTTNSLGNITQIETPAPSVPDSPQQASNQQQTKTQNNQETTALKEPEKLFVEPEPQTINAEADTEVQKSLATNTTALLTTDIATDDTTIPVGEETEITNPEVAASSEPAKQEDIPENQLAQSTSDTTSETVSQLLTDAEQALSLGRLDDNDDESGALSLVKQAYELNSDHTEIKKLLGKAIDQRHHTAEKQMNRNNLDQAETLLKANDDLIREFVYTEKLQRQVHLESKLSILRTEQQQVTELLQKADDALKRGDLNRNDTKDNALTHLTNLLFKKPGHPEGKALLEKLVVIHHQASREAMVRNNLEQAKSSMEETESLIRKYRLSATLKQAQRTLEQDYQQAVLNPAPEQPVAEQNQTAGYTLTVEKQTPGEQAGTASIRTESQSSSNTPTDQQQVITPQAANSIPIPTISQEENPLDNITEQAEPLAPQQVFVPTATPAAANAQAVPIWEENSLNLPQQNNRITQPVVVYEPTPQIQITQPRVQYETTAQAVPQQQSTTASPPQAPINQNQVVTQQQAEVIEVLPEPITELQPEIPLQPAQQAYTATSVPQHQETVHNQQNQFQAAEHIVELEELVPELQEIPVSAIEEILPVQGQ